MNSYCEKLAIIENSYCEKLKQAKLEENNDKILSLLWELNILRKFYKKKINKK